MHPEYSVFHRPASTPLQGCRGQRAAAYGPRGADPPPVTETQGTLCRPNKVTRLDRALPVQRLGQVRDCAAEEDAGRDTTGIGCTAYVFCTALMMVYVVKLGVPSYTYNALRQQRMHTSQSTARTARPLINDRLVPPLKDGETGPP